MVVQKSDIERKLRQIESIVDETTEQAKSTATVAVVAIVVVIFLAFVFGRKRGKKSGGARVEVFRIR